MKNTKENDAHKTSDGKLLLSNWTSKCHSGLDIYNDTASYNAKRKRNSKNTKENLNKIENNLATIQTTLQDMKIVVDKTTTRWQKVLLIPELTTRGQKHKV